VRRPPKRPRPSTIIDPESPPFGEGFPDVGEDAGSPADGGFSGQAALGDEEASFAAAVEHVGVAQEVFRNDVLEPKEGIESPVLGRYKQLG
jgi:hypothetical protein